MSRSSRQMQRCLSPWILPIRLAENIRIEVLVSGPCTLYACTVQCVGLQGGEGDERVVGEEASTAGYGQEAGKRGNGYLYAMAVKRPCFFLF
jgi:hypothetical protein